jgi:hypothetical protein
MKTRLGKIAQLPKPIRDDLNRRLQNGRQGPELLAWLNELPETREILPEFNDQPINKSNLSDWRHGGFLEWLHDQAREARIQRVSESGATFEKAETGDLFENFARFAVAELMDDLDSLQKFRGEKRSRSLRDLIRALARLQFGYNHSRRTELAWTKYNDTRPRRAAVPPAGQPNPTSSPATEVKPGGAESCDRESHDDARPTYDPFKSIYHKRCCHEPCAICHAPDSDYPLDEVLRDEQFYKQHGQHPCDRHGRHRHLFNTYCDCSCDRCAEKSAANQEPPKSPEAHNAESRNTEPAMRNPVSHIGPINPTSPISNISPISPISPIPYNSVAASLRRISLLETRSPANHAHLSPIPAEPAMP